MSWKNSKELIRSTFYSAAVLCLTVAALLFTAAATPAAVFPGTGTGAIPDSPTGGTICGDYTAAPRDVSFAVTGMSGAPTAVSVDMSITHTWGADVWVQLIAPDGTTSVTIFKQRGAPSPTACGSSTPLAGPYNFTDNTPDSPSFFTVTGSPVPAGNYRAVAPLTGAVTPITSAFAGLSDANGTWILRVLDGGQGDLGTVTAANLTIESGGGGGGSSWVNVDMDGDGQSDYGVVRESSGALRFDPEVRMTARQRQAAKRQRAESLGVTELTWYTATTSDNTIAINVFGNNFDTLVPNDYDGDSMTDLAVWRTDGTDGAFHIFESSTSTVRVEDFGQEGDNPTVAGDYDGDGSADVAVYRCPISAGQCSYFYRGSDNNPGGAITFVPWGNGADGDFFPAVGDFDGDGSNDFCIQRSNPDVAGGGQFLLLRSSDGGVEFVNWGFDTDFIVPGDYDGDGSTDFGIRRTESGQHIYWILTRTGSVIAVPWGITGDVSVPGDYDGDGSTDIATWRGNADPNENWYYILRSSDGALQAYEWGASTSDVPMAGWLVQ